MAEELLLICLFVGAFAGWLAGVIVKGYGFGTFGNVVVGVIGAFLGGWLFGQLGGVPGSAIAGSLIAASGGAVILLFLLSLLRRAA